MKFTLSLVEITEPPASGLGWQVEFNSDNADDLHHDVAERAMILADKLAAQLPFVDLSLWHIDTGIQIVEGSKFEAFIFDSNREIKVHEIIHPTPDKPHGLIIYDFSLNGGLQTWCSIIPENAGCEWRKN